MDNEFDELLDLFIELWNMDKSNKFVYTALLDTWERFTKLNSIDSNELKCFIRLKRNQYETCKDFEKVSYTDLAMEYFMNVSKYYQQNLYTYDEDEEIWEKFQDYE